MRSSILVFMGALVLASLGGITSESIGCFRHGECRLSNAFNITRDVADSDACSATCSDTMGCNFFTFHQDIADCFLFEHCNDLSYDGCPRCISGEAGCSCFMNGRCNGPLIGTMPTDDENACRDACITNPSCLAFTFDTVSQDCIQLLNCQEIYPDDSEFISGWTGCSGGPAPEDVPRFAMMVGGYAPSETDDVEIVDLQNPDTTCLKPASFPLRIIGAVGTYRDGKVLVCGGNSGYEDCYEYSFDTDSWEFSALNFNIARDFASSMMLANDTFFVTGGNDGTELLVGNSFVEGPDLPTGLEDLRYHCAARVNETHAFIAGGSSFGTFDRDQAHLLDLRSGEWTQLPNMPDERYFGPACGAINGGTEIVMAGGWSGIEKDDSSDSCVILKLGDSSWRTGPTLPVRSHGIASFAYGDTFMATGGYDNNGPVGELAKDLILIFDEANYEWITLEQKLAVARDYHTAIPLPESAGQLCT